MRLLVLDDTTLDKPYARNTELVTYHWSGKGERVVAWHQPSDLSLVGMLSFLIFGIIYLKEILEEVRW
jgi:hypothetical protein